MDFNINIIKLNSLNKNNIPIEWMKSKEWNTLLLVFRLKVKCFLSVWREIKV